MKMFKHAPQNVSILAMSAILVGSVSLAQQTVDMPILPNTEPETGPVSNNAGFSLSLDGVPVDSDPQIEDRVRQTGIALAQAGVQIQLDTIDPTPRLDVEIAGAPRDYVAGDRVTLISETNYPAYIERAEMRIIDCGAPGGPRLVTTVPVNANGQVSIDLPEGRDLVVVHRVYDGRGRFDETQSLSLLRPDGRGQVDDVEEGTQFSANRNIPVRGGTVTVSATNVAQGAVLETLGERVRPDSNGRLVIERILPSGDYVVDVNVTGGGQNIGLTRPVVVPGSEWFYVVVADLTYGRYSDGQTNTDYTSTTGRLQYYVEGETENGVEITSSLDTGEHELDEIFSRLDEKDPNDIIERIDPNSGYVTYGDDSTMVDNTPTSGKFYLRIQQDNNFAVWGDYQATLAGNGYVRNERNLYGAQAHLEADTTTERGDVRSSLDLYAAQPEQAVGRDVFQGTGGSVYFLNEQDIAPGTQTISIELRDSVTGRIVDRMTLVEGRDYQINALQGIVTLNEPLSATLDRRLISTTGSGDETVNLVAQYEYTSTTSDIDGFSFGGRVEHWLTDDLRIGLSAISDDDGTRDQRSLGVDLRYQVGEDSFVQLDYARSDGRGFDTTFSDDGGLVFDTNAAVDGSGEAIKIEAQFELADLGYARTGDIGGYFEDRTEGFTTLDYRVTAATGDETLYGLYANVETEPGKFGYSLYADVYENGIGDDRLELGAEVSAQLSERLGLDAAVEFLDETTAGVSGNRTDLAVQLNYAISDSLEIFAFGQGTLSVDGLENNDRYGVGFEAALENGWEAGAFVSDGHGGLGARIIATQTREDNSSTYFGYELDPGRALDAGIAESDNGGRYVLGRRRKVNEDVAVFGENTYDIFGTSQELIGAYGVTYTRSDFLSYTASYDLGQLQDATTGDIERQALSLGLRYEDEQLRTAARVELRFDDHEDAALSDTESYFVVVDGEYKFSEESRMLFSIDFVDTQANGASFQDGRFVDAVLGYAHRPIDNERLNVLASYRYFFDDLGQELDGVSNAGPVQETHVLSIEANYDLNEKWTIGGKFGGRWAESAATAGGIMTSNDAYLAVINARYHLVHNWDVLLEARHLALVDAGASDTSFLGAGYYQVNNNLSVGAGYNFGSFSDDLTDMTFDDQGVFLNLVAKY
jgi:hypothetical protein